MKASTFWITVLWLLLAASCVGLYVVATKSTDTWVEEVAAIPRPAIVWESNVCPPPEFWNTSNTARLVTNRVTGEQVLVIGEGWREWGLPVYRILRRVTVKVGGMKKTGYYWAAETRHLNELEPIPSI